MSHKTGTRGKPILICRRRGIGRAGRRPMRLARKGFCGPASSSQGPWEVSGRSAPASSSVPIFSGRLTRSGSRRCGALPDAHRPARAMEMRCALLGRQESFHICAWEDERLQSRPLPAFPTRVDPFAPTIHATLLTGACQSNNLVVTGGRKRNCRQLRGNMTTGCPRSCSRER